jgi:thioredoxin 1
MAKEIRSTEWQAEVVESTVPVLVDVFGTYCPPCRALAPTIDRLAMEYEGRAKVVKLDVEADRDLAGGLHVTSVPTVIAFRDGKESGRLVGLRPEGAYRQLLEAAGVSSGRANDADTPSRRATSVSTTG